MNDQENRNRLLEKLRSGPVNVKFTKVNGEKREMNCTLNKKFLPETENQKESQRRENPDVQSVWDLDKQAWRSFRWANLEDF